MFQISFLFYWLFDHCVKGVKLFLRRIKVIFYYLNKHIN